VSQDLQVTLTLSGSGTLADDATDVEQRFVFGGAVLPAVTVSFTHGTGNNQADKSYLELRTLATVTTDSIDLTALTDFQGDALSFAKVKYIGVFIVSPDGTKELRVGPQNVANAFDGFWGGTGATVYDRVLHSAEYKHPVGGVATGGTDKVLAIHNPGGTSVSYALWVIGTSV
jgi:hypothetical protein